MNGMGHIPLVRLVAPLLLGIIAWLVAGFLFPQEIFFAVYVSGLLVWFGLRHFFLANMSRRWIFGAITHLLLFVAGYHHAGNHFQVARQDHFSHWQDEAGFLLLKVTQPVSEKANSYQAIGRVEALLGDSVQRKLRGKLMVYLQKDSLAAAVQYGDMLLLENQYQEVRPPQNPAEFNYRGFLARSNIYHQTYRRSGQWHPTGENRGNWVVARALQMRQAALHNLEANHLTGKEFAVVSALLLGFREYLDEDLQREFAGAGAMHILCVSGLHVGIIFLVLKTIFGFLSRMRYGIFLRTFLIIMLIWFYAAITGFTPSVMRASTMFSFVALGQSFRRSTNIYNTLAGSALVLVLIDPYIISRIGFQLSYLAVISIVALQPWLYKKLYFKNYLIDKAWAIITVSIAAQLATGPLALFYFNQFPNYFLLTNLVVIPLASFIIYSALLTLFLTPVPWLGLLMGKILYGLVYALHSSVRLIEGLPHSTTSGVFINLPETLFIFGLMLTMGIFMVRAWQPGLKVALGLALVLSVSVSARGILNARESRVVVYHVNNGLAMDFISGKDCVFVSCPTVQENPRLVNFHIADNRLRHGIRAPRAWLTLDGEGVVNAGNVYRNGPFLRFREATFFILDGDTGVGEWPRPDFPIDYLIVSRNPRINPQVVLDALQPRLVILDTSNSFRNLRRWEENCETAGVECWSVRVRGAYMARL